MERELKAHGNAERRDFSRRLAAPRNDNENSENNDALKPHFNDNYLVELGITCSPAPIALNGTPKPGA
jgi:hypothetical protein